MAVTVAELLQLPHLQASLVGGAGGVDRLVSWVHTSDLPNAWEWHGSGELLLTNGTGLPPDPADQVEFVTRLAATGASGLALGLGMAGPPLTAQLLHKVDEIGLPLLTVPFNVPFTAVVRAVADANEREEYRQVLMVARLYELLRRNIAAGPQGASLLEQLGKELDVRLFLVDPVDGRSLLEDGVESEFAAELVAGFEAHGGSLPGMLGLRKPDAEPGSTGAVAVAVPADRPIALVVEGRGRELPNTVLLQHAAAGGALELAQLTARAERRRRAAADLFNELVDRRLAERTAVGELADFGLDISDLVVVAMRPTSGVARPPAEASLLRRRVPHLLVSRAPHLLFLLPASSLEGDPEWPEEPGGAGCSAPVVAAGRVPAAVGEAVWALAAAETGRRGVVRYGEESVLLPRTPAEARSVVARVLGGLLASDAERHSDYILTVRTLLEHERSWKAAADALHIHRQTLGYRLRRIESMTGRGFALTEHLAEWWIGLRALDLVEGLGGYEPGQLPE